MPTKEQMRAEMIRMAEEITALRDLIAAVAECADVPIAAAGHSGRDDRLAWTRADTIQANLRGIDWNGEYLAAALSVRAQSLRETAAVPVTYEVRDSAQDGGQ